MAENLIGQKFGKLTVIEKAVNSKQAKQMWVCKCDCGKIKSKPIATYDLKSGKVKSCGCLYFESNKERNKTHGLTRSRLYQVWQGMKSRCHYTQNVTFKNYGGRGIKVCDEWLHNFKAFYDWAMSHGYSDELTIDRIDVNGDYCPENCKWVSMKDQQNNRRNNKIISYENKEYTLAQLAEKLNLSSATLGWRLNNGWNIEDLSLPPSLSNRKIRSKKQ